METHAPVLRTEAIEALHLTPHARVIDATLGSGGHARAILDILDEHGTFIGLDVDHGAIETAGEQLTGARSHVELIAMNFRDIASLRERCALECADAVLADLGWRIEQFTEGGKGFSFTANEPLLMTLGDPKDYSFTARDIVNIWDREQIVTILRAYGEERYARRIADAIIAARSVSPIETAKELADIVETAVPRQAARKRIHPATKTFQALRITVNDELTVLSTFIDDAYELLCPGGRLAIITFHSVEDRIVKRRFMALTHDHGAVRITKKPLAPSAEEVLVNPRARSAKLRVIEKPHDYKNDNFI